MPSKGGETAMAAAPHSKKAARALHRTAPDTTADCAVPPLFHQSMKPEMVASGHNNFEGKRNPGQIRSMGMAMR